MEGAVKISALVAASMLFVAPFRDFEGVSMEENDHGVSRKNI